MFHYVEQWVGFATLATRRTNIGKIVEIPTCNLILEYNMGFEFGNFTGWNVSLPVENSTFVSCVNSVEGNCHAQIEGGDSISRLFFKPLSTDPNCFVKSFMCLSFDYRVTVLDFNISTAAVEFVIGYFSPFGQAESWYIPLTSFLLDSTFQSVWTTQWITVPVTSFPVEFDATITNVTNYLELDNFQWTDGACPPV